MNRVTIKDIFGLEVLDSRGTPTLEAVITFEDGSSSRAIVPSGASKGKFEACELRDEDPKRYLGKGVTKAIHLLENVIKPSIIGRTFNSLIDFDSALLELDSSPQKSKLGANTILAASMSFAHGLARANQIPLYRLFQQTINIPSSPLVFPIPLMNVLNGGLHANNGLEIQEFMIVPHGFSSFSEALRAGTEVFQVLKNNLAREHCSTAVGDEGGFAPTLKSNREALERIMKAIEGAGYRPLEEIALALDVASSSFYNEEGGYYEMATTSSAKRSSTEEMIQFYENLVKDFPIVSIEDGLNEEDWNGWAELTSRLKKIQLVGDDLFVTQLDKVTRGIEHKVANSVLIKVNQVGSLKETLETIQLCKRSGYSAVVSHRSGETEDVTIAHLAVGTASGQIKTGSLSRGERTAKYNELLRIEDDAKRAQIPVTYRSPFLR